MKKYKEIKNFLYPVFTRSGTSVPRSRFPKFTRYGTWYLGPRLGRIPKFTRYGTWYFGAPFRLPVTRFCMYLPSTLYIYKEIFDIRY